MRHLVCMLIALLFASLSRAQVDDVVTLARFDDDIDGI